MSQQFKPVNLIDLADFKSIHIQNSNNKKESKSSVAERHCKAFFLKIICAQILHKQDN